MATLCGHPAPAGMAELPDLVQHSIIGLRRGPNGACAWQHGWEGLSRLAGPSCSNPADALSDKSVRAGDRGDRWRVVVARRHAPDAAGSARAGREALLRVLCAVSRPAEP